MTRAVSRRSFANLKIRTRVLLGFGAVFALLVILAGLGIDTLRNNAQQIEALTGMQGRTAEAMVVERDFVELRSEVLRVAMQMDAAAVSRVEARRAELTARTAALADRFIHPETRALAAQIRDRFRAYAADAEKLVAFRTQLSRLRDDRLDPAGKTAAQKLTAILDAAFSDEDMTISARAGIVEHFVMQALLNATRFLDHGNRAAGEAMQKDFAEAGKALTLLREQATDPRYQRWIGEFATAFDDYKKTFEEMFSLNVQLQTLLRETMPATATALSGDSAMLKQLMEGQLKAASAEMIESSRQAITLGLATVGVILVLAVMVAMLLARSIARPITGMTGAMSRLAAGDMTVVIPGVGRGDEIGAMAGAVQVFRDSMTEADRLRTAQAAAAERSEQEKRATMIALADRFEASVGAIVNGVAAAATELTAAAGTVSHTSEDADRRATAVAAAAEQASANVQTVAAAAEELSGSIGEIARQVGVSSRTAGQAVQEANRTDGTVRSLSETARKIGDVVKLINDIAGQTNLLALNATIEAARAGEAGKGFAVVASEVKTLANQTTRATEEIAGQVAAIQSATADAVAAIGGIGGTVGEIESIVTAIAAAVEEQSAATQEIASNVSQAAHGTGEVTTNVVGLSQSVGSARGSATQMLNAAQELSQQAERLRADVDGFLATVRAA